MEAGGASSARPWTRRTWAALGLLVLLMLAALPWLVNPWHPAMPGARDAAMYLACAKSLVAGEGYSYLGQPFVIRPPGMSLLLAPIVATRGYDFLAVNWMVSLFGVAAAAALFAWSVRFVGEWVAGALTLCVWWNGTFQEFCNRAMSDVPGLATLLGCLLLSRWAERGPGWRRELVLGLAIGASAYLRSATILLVPALALERVCARWLQGGEPWPAFARRRLAWLVVVPALVLAPWSLRDARHAPRGQVEQTQIASYSVGMWHTDPSDPSSPRVTLGDVLARVPERSAQILSLVGTSLASDTASGARRAFGALVLALALVTLVRRRRAAELYLFGYAATIAVYFGFHERLGLPIWVLAWVAAIEALHDLAVRFPSGLRSVLLSGCLLALGFLGPWPREHWPQFESQHQRYVQLCAAVEAQLAADARPGAASEVHPAEVRPEIRLGAPLGWHFALYLDRPVWSLYLAWSRERDAAKIDELVAEHRLDYVVLAPFDGVSHELYPPLVARYGNPRRVGTGYLFRVR